MHREPEVQKNILYIHGFNSSPLSTKAEQARKYFHQHYPDINFVCPQLATSPDDVLRQLEGVLDSAIAQRWYLIGSSLGGYFSHYLSCKYQLPAVLINPAIKPYDLLEEYIGEQTNPYTKIVYQVTEQHMYALKAIEQSAPTFNDIQKNNYLVMVQTGDEVLDYQQAADKFQHSHLIVEQGGDHSFIDFEKKLPLIADFLQLNLS